LYQERNAQILKIFVRIIANRIPVSYAYGCLWRQL